MATQPGITAADLFIALKRAGELLTLVVEEMEPALERAVAMSAGQLSLIASEAPSGQHQLVQRTADWAKDVLDPLERLLGLASAPPYAAAQDEIQKRIIADLREEVTSLRARVNTLKARVLENQAKSLN
ncbi:MAG: hypothetical protein CL889_05075 [Dehalococcoidia bacterium]|nr:hypothetical protein [Dehalococcoidia bacterium]|tara:strand:+ start:6667 stop:7053 length:387 start_codon:yes stop_codon:yes gene_type:complete